MRIETVFIPFKFEGMNEIIAAAKKRGFAYNNMKKKNYKICSTYFSRVGCFTSPVTIHYSWYEENKKRDLDNIAAAKKFINDSLVKCGVLENDSYRFIKGFSDSFHYEKYKVGVEIKIQEIEK